MTDRVRLWVQHFCVSLLSCHVSCVTTCLVSHPLIVHSCLSPNDRQSQQNRIAVTSGQKHGLRKSMSINKHVHFILRKDSRDHIDVHKFFKQEGAQIYNKTKISHREPPIAPVRIENFLVVYGHRTGYKFSSFTPENALSLSSFLFQLSSNDTAMSQKCCKHILFLPVHLLGCRQRSRVNRAFHHLLPHAHINIYLVPHTMHILCCTVRIHLQWRNPFPLRSARNMTCYASHHIPHQSLIPHTHTFHVFPLCTTPLLSLLSLFVLLFLILALW